MSTKIQPDIESKFKKIFNKCLKGGYEDMWVKYSSDLDKIPARLNDEAITLMFDCIESKIKTTPYEELLTSTYKLFHYSDKRLPLTKVIQLLTNLKTGNKPDIKAIFDAPAWEPWEKQDQAGFAKLTTNSADATELCKTLQHLTENSENYFKLRRFDSRYANLEIRNKADRGSIIFEDGIFELALQHKQAEPIVAEYVKKQTEYNAIYPIHYMYGYSTPRQNQPVGHLAAAALAIYDAAKYDEQIEAFLQTLEKCDWFELMGKEMRGLWRRQKMTANLPKIFTRYPQLNPEI